MKKIQLTKGNFAIVDDEDYEELMKYTWRDHSGYASRITSRKYGKRKSILMHRQLMGFPGEVDHINGNKSDNRRSNLRVVTREQNSFNMSAKSNNSCLGYKGVGFDKRNSKFISRIGKSGKKIWLGYFDNPHDAARMYNFWAADLFGEYARLNVINEEENECQS